MPDAWRRSIAARPRVWVLGSAHPSADMSIAWGDPFPNFSDPDVLIVDLTTLTVPVLERMGGQKLEEARQSIRDKYYSRGIVVVITQPTFSITKEENTRTNYSMLPIELQTKKVPKGHAIMWGDHEIFRAYRPHVGHFSFHIESHEPKLTRPPFAMLKNFELLVPHCQGIMDRSQHYLGAMLTVREWDDFEWRPSVAEMGQLVLLPPPTGPVRDAIGSILSVYGKADPAGRPGAQAPRQEKAAGPAAGKDGIGAARRPTSTGESGPPGGSGPGKATPGGSGGLPAAVGKQTHDVFLSYSHEDKDSVARPLAEGLAKRSISVWWDQSAMGIGDNLPQKIREGLTRARHGVAVVSREYLDSGWGQTELGGMFLKNLPIFPIMHGVTAEEAQKKLPALSGKIMRPWSDSPESIMDEIADAIEGRGGGADQGGPSASAHGEPQGRGSPAAAVAARTSAKARPRAGGAPGMLPPPCRPSPDTERLLAGRKILSPESPDFAQNARFAGLYAGSLGDGEKPAVLFTAIPHDRGARCDATAPDFMEWARSATSVEVDGRRIRMLGTKWSVDIGTLVAVESHPETAGRNVVLYREFQSGGLFEWGTSYLFFGRNDRNKVELHLCYMVGEFWAFLASARLFYKKIGFDAPFSALLSVRNTRSLDLLNIGNEVYNGGWDIRRRFSPAPPDPATMHDHIQLPYTFSSTREMTDERIASVAKRAATDVCNAYGQAAPACYGADGSFSWRLWDDIASVATRGGRL